ncbi:polar amino acid ABC transporter permease [Collimonas sp. OK412]|jgi:polar amino acid transport system permease protein|uniref:polar amino acid ABC transporter permease n=1 Tax=Collimonas sp. (strain OK412) TaxID=1801619 RepID=UPI0008DF4895|nr:polar amino acid ABC transporter permease [Collimonas sp. OK412]SFB73210.1 polar amino acid transport system permease protein [Collimonas sp. OK412]
MGWIEITRNLLEWTPFLAIGFMWNILISVLALGIGAACGGLLVLLRLSRHRKLALAGASLTEFMRNVPTFVFQIYLMFMLPESLMLPFSTINLSFPSWLKAALALALAVAGFVSDNLLSAIQAWRNERFQNALLFIPNLCNFFVIIIMASSTASVIGVSELVSRCNTVINASGTTQIMLWVYLYAMIWFFLFCYMVTAAINKFSSGMLRRIST